jgi:TPR repeat protein
MALDVHLAPKLFLQAAEQHHADAMAELSLCHLLPFRGIPQRYQDPGLAFRMAKKGHRLQSALGTFALALCYENGAGMARADEGMAKALLEQARKRGEPNATCRHAKTLEVGSKDDIAEAVALYTKAAEEGHTGSMCAMARLFEYGAGFYEKSAAKAAEWLERAVCLGDVDAMYTLGGMYEFFNLESTAEKSRARAFLHYEEAAQHGHPKAMKHLGSLYTKGSGVKSNVDMALRWYRRAAQHGLVDSLTPYAEAIRAIRPDHARELDEFVSELKGGRNSVRRVACAPLWSGVWRLSSVCVCRCVGGQGGERFLLPSHLPALSSFSLSLSHSVCLVWLHLDVVVPSDHGSRCWRCDGSSIVSHMRAAAASRHSVTADRTRVCDRVLSASRRRVPRSLS